MRTAGVVVDGRGLRVHDHVCWVYDDLATLRAAALQFLADGLAHGERVCYVGGPLVDDMRSALADLEHADGAVWVSRFADVFDRRHVVIADAAIAVCTTATQNALRDGFSGFRLVIDATELVLDADQRDAYARFEHLIDRALATMPFAAMCAYDRRRLGDAVDELCCMHPAANDDGCAFGVSAAASGDVVLRGEIDGAVDQLFQRALSRCDGEHRRQEVVVDATQVSFLDHRALCSIDAHVRSDGSSAVLRTRSQMPGRLRDLLRLDALRVELVR